MLTYVDGCGKSPVHAGACSSLSASAPEASNVSVRVFAMFLRFAGEPEPHVKVHPAKAHELGIEEGEMVVVESPRGRIEMRVKYSNEIDSP